MQQSDKLGKEYWRKAKLANKKKWRYLGLSAIGMCVYSEWLKPDGTRVVITLN